MIFLRGLNCWQLLSDRVTTPRSLYPVLSTEPCSDSILYEGTVHLVAVLWFHPGFFRSVIYRSYFSCSWSSDVLYLPGVLLHIPGVPMYLPSVRLYIPGGLMFLRVFLPGDLLELSEILIIPLS
jgi:hypothetical protein